MHAAGKRCDFGNATGVEPQPLLTGVADIGVTLLMLTIGLKLNDV
jgi:predicted Kef-type K+ transport protein